MRILLLLLCLFPCVALGIPESNYAEVFEKEVLPFYETGESLRFQAKDGVTLHYRRFLRGNKKAILILPGRTEPTSKYAELVYDLRDMNYDFFLLDLRSQGYSERLIPKDTGKQYVKHYEDWVDDLAQLYRDDIEKRGYESLTLIAHSMGGGVALRFAELYPTVFSKMILSSPMIEIDFRGLGEFGARTLTGLFRLFGRGKSYVPGGRAGTEPYLFAGNNVTSSEIRFQMARDLEKKDPSLLMGSATVKWVSEAIKLSKKTYKERKKLPKIPILMFQAENDTIIRKKRQNRLCKEQGFCKKVDLKKAQHEMFQEVDAIRDIVIAETRAFLESQ